MIYVHSGLQDLLPGALDTGGTRYILYGDSGYNIRWLLKVPHQRENISVQKGCEQLNFSFFHSRLMDLQGAKSLLHNDLIQS